MATGWPMKTTYANGDVYSASDVNDITGTINLLGQSVAYAAGKNKIINGAFNVWQRGTSFTNPANFSYLCDRFRWGTDGTGMTTTFSQQSFTPGTAPVSGYEGTFFMRWARTVATSGATYDDFYQPIEDVRQLAGQTSTVSFWAKADSSRNVTVVISQSFGSGGSAQVNTIAGTASVTTSWQRFTFSVAVPSVSGKTIGASSNVAVVLRPATFNTTFTLDLWGVQLEAGSTATAFQTASGTIQGELALCQRYYYRMQSTTAGDSFFGTGLSNSTTGASILVTFPVTMRTRPTSLEQTGTAADYRIRQATTTTACSAVPSYDSAENFTAFVNMTVASGLTAGQAIVGRSANTSSYLAWSAEL